MTTVTARRQFIEDYRRIRSAEGRGSADSLYYRSLPFHDNWQWQMRARTFRYFVRHVLPKQPCDILDLGAGNCWLSYRLREMQHRPVAIDIFSDPLDGLASARHYPVSFPTIEGDFNGLPFPARRFDLAIFNASIHYSSDYRKTLMEAKRLLRPGGRVVILDSPIYTRHEHGERMRAERQTQFQQQYGFRSEALGSIEFFDRQMLRDLGRDLNIRWDIHRPWYGWRWHLRPLKARVTGQRPPSRFWILVGHFE